MQRQNATSSTLCFQFKHAGLSYYQSKYRAKVFLGDKHFSASKEPARLSLRSLLNSGVN
jgi:hypothetical protein